MTIVTVIMKVRSEIKGSGSAFSIYTGSTITVLFIVPFVTVVSLLLFHDYLVETMHPVRVTAQECSLSVGTIKWCEIFTAALLTEKSSSVLVLC